MTSKTWATQPSTTFTRGACDGALKQHVVHPARLVDGEPSPALTASGDSNVADAAMERYSVGDDAAFAVVYDALAPRIFGYLRRKLGSVSRAEDVVQQTFLHMHRARGTFVPGSRVSPWGLRSRAGS